MKRKEGAYIRSKIPQEFALGASQLGKDDRFLMENTEQDILALSGVHKKIWLRALATARLVGKNKRKRRKANAGCHTQGDTNHNKVILPDTEEDSRRKRRRQWDSCYRKRVKEK